MTQQIRRFGIGQTAKVVGALYGFMGLIFVPFFLIGAAMAPDEMGFGMGLAILFPILYAVIGFIFTAIACAIYNFVARFVGGIEVEMEAPALGTHP
ncbi:MAG TPA: DUF3566 domain-containing protein [Gemmatimonadaceae bacterium]|nr:DUF3566 domain-containing protein [Gemmatimonadaceae bacterium]